MTQLFQNSLPAERDRGCILADSFRSASEVNKNSGTIVGVPTFRDGGIYLDGSTNYISYNFTPTFTEWSFIMEFIPYRPYNGTQEFLFAIIPIAPVYVALYRVTNGRVDDYYNSYDISSVWKQYQKNVLVVTEKAGTNNKKIYLNGVLVGQHNSSLSRKYTTGLYLGCDASGLNKFNGVIKAVKFFNKSITSEEVLDYCNNSVFNYNDKATLILPMTNRCHDITNVQTLDVTKNGNHFRLGDGVTANTFPTKLTRSKGYSKNTLGNSYFQHANIPTLFSRPFAISILLNINNWAVSPLLFSQSNGTTYSIQNYLNCDNSSGVIYFVAYNGGYISMATFNIPNKPRGLMHLVLNYKDLTTPTGKCWFNGRDVTTGFTSTGVWFNNNEQFLLGCYYPGLQHLRENIYDFRIWDGMALTELQIKDLYHNLLRELNRV